MKSLLWLVLCVALVANVLLNVMAESGLQLALSICAGITVIGSGVGLWVLRGPRES
ncbi:MULTISPECIES: hypothetical protein [Streptomyces]|uniref:Uncharacterized protein n=2 Tax=Streptomyces TaxID=1883 RepID=A0ABU2RVK7_9ACTN|nr:MULTISPECIES: hypothetical protein [unclassified Streptomyces]MBK3591205.1 hypothetical protein [Streptomyces sp. MBT51]MDT0432711.1 hypothetical protein [Streptomyces sp. DSM 41770]